MKRTTSPIHLGLLLILALGACSPAADQEKKTLKLATTTSTRDSGLLDQLLPAFEQVENCRVEVIAVGTGAALRLGEAGDVDVVLVHAKKAEEEFLRAGFADRREEFMVNFFMLLGPTEDPAGLKGLDPVAAMKKLGEQKAAFVSRGDDSGTHKKELGLRRAAGFESGWDGLIESGQGMGATLTMADEKGAYVLCDAGTYANFAAKMKIVPLIAEGDALRNPYAVMPLSQERHPAVQSELANRFADYLISEKAQRLIRDYKIGGQSLFFPTRLGGTSGN